MHDVYGYVLRFMPWVFLSEENLELVTLYKGDLVAVIGEEDERYWIEMMYGDLPRTRGYVEKDSVSFDYELFPAFAAICTVREGAMAYDDNGEELPEIAFIYGSGLNVVERKDGKTRVWPWGGGAETDDGTVWVNDEDVDYERIYNDEYIIFNQAR